MEFNNVSFNDCNCLSEGKENFIDMFARKVRPSKDLKDADFRTHFERGKIPSNELDCEEVCGLHGVSMELWDDKSSILLMEKYLLTAKFSPQNKKNLCIIKLKQDCGLVKYTPNQQAEYNEYHYDFIKDDAFLVTKLELVKMIQLNA